MADADAPGRDDLGGDEGTATWIRRFNGRRH